MMKKWAQLFFRMCFGMCAVLSLTTPVCGQSAGGSDDFKVMDINGLQDEELKRLLEGYYRKGFGGSDAWQETESFRAKGIIKQGKHTYHFKALKKKPSYSKVELYSVGWHPLSTLCYDGKQAWTVDSSADGRCTDMPSEEARDFIRDAGIGNHLLNATMPGKHIDLGDFREVDGISCRDINVTLPDGELIVYSLGLGDYSLRRQVMVNHAAGWSEEIIFSDFRMIQGIQVAFGSRMLVDGELKHTVEFESAAFDTGVMVWMFERPEE